ncbi:Lrp/AsnC family transcriptional regulator [Kiloniella laminariae]|uniref:Lrp/AsnC family transcriptional regulator n=1 Tax=Kiloniella laminariae TaxID=454162 RepID=A0ABT4LE35_9PROT|nr:Lrp/AsnC family transcriptional regulator [Kiloniella laminariae]MCZ4279362.1 Lrp/AsnC family transcriptional regulator [Kiloniella laminariae]
MLNLDDTDRALISLLRKDARLPVVSISHHLKISRATVQKRIERLLAKKVIHGFTIKTASPDNQMPIRAQTHIKMQSKSHKRLIAYISGKPEVIAVHTISGPYDILVEIQALSLEKLDDALADIRTHEDVMDTETSILLATHYQ